MAIIKRKIYSLSGLALPPEATAYGLARYSRSAAPAKDTFTEMSEKILKGSEAMKKFFEVFYFQYGHASIADLAHVAMALENISMVAAIEVVDEPVWDGQERSTRYQKFSLEGVHIPTVIKHKPQLLKSFQTAIKYQMAEYETQYKELLEAVRVANPLPNNYPEGAYKAATRARAFDMTRYMLPLGSYTSVGQITSGRTLEKMISRLLSNEYSEVREVAADLKTACNTPSFNPFTKEINTLLKDITNVSTNVKRLKRILKTTAPVPSLVKYTAPIKYLIETKKDLQQVAREYLKIKNIDSSNDVVVYQNQEPLVEAVTTLLYGVTHYSYGQISQQVNSWNRKKLAEVYEVGTKRRTRHDELSRALDTHSLTFDILMDIGSFRDMHRHRRTVQVRQDYTYEHGYTWHPEIERYGNLYPYQVAMDAICATGKKLDKINHEAGVYAMPLGCKNRFLLKMGWNELDYIGKLRTGKGRHLSYWNIALRMVEEASKLCPERTKHIPTTPLEQDSVYER
ncbi:MAG: FAD-dependent thymidylate synthase [Patescibacteria group bacterium]|jgi:thymidylate synthase ThyX